MADKPYNSLKKIIETLIFLEESKKSKKDGMRSVKHGADNNPKVTKMDFLPKSVLDDIADKKDLDEKKKRKRPGDSNYYKGTRKSNKSMEREINKCAKEPRPKSCYDYWSADKQYDKSKKKNETLEELIKEMIELEEKKKRKKSKSLSKKTRDTLKKKAEKANMPLGALTSVYRKGLAAWLTGHRQGTPQHAWAMGRVNSFIRGGKTRSVDKAEWKKVQNHRKKKKK